MTVELTETDSETGEIYTFTLYRIKGFNGEKLTKDYEVKVGDEVIAYGKLINYKESKPEMQSSGYLVALNGKMSLNEEQNGQEGTIEVNDPVIKGVMLAGSHNEWSTQAESFSAIEADKAYTITVDLSKADVEDEWKFKFCPVTEDATYWVGYGELASQDGFPEWITTDQDGNFVVNIEDTSYRVFTIMVAWDGGDEIGKNWYIRISGSESGGIDDPNPEEQNPTITIYVISDNAPYMWAWDSNGNNFFEEWPGVQMSEKESKYNNEFWTMTFTVKNGLNILFNNGSGAQTSDITYLSGDRFYYYDGWNYFEDRTYMIVEQAKEILRNYINQAQDKNLDISKQQNAIYSDNLKEIEKATAEIIALMGTYYESTASTESPIDMTNYIVNPNFDDQSTYGWQGTVPGFGNDNQKYAEVAEYYNKVFDTYQILENMPAGIYTLSANGFYRGWIADAQNGTNYNAHLYATSGNKTAIQPLHNPWDIFNEQSFAGETSFGARANEAIEEYGDKVYYAPNDPASARIYFENGYYNNVLTFESEGGLIKIGVKNEKNIRNDWTTFDNFKLIYYGNGADAYQLWTNYIVSNANKYEGAECTTSILDAYNNSLTNVSASTKEEALAIEENIKNAEEALLTNISLWEQLQTKYSEAEYVNKDIYIQDQFKTDLQSLMANYLVWREQMALSNEELTAKIQTFETTIAEARTHIAEGADCSYFLVNGDFENGANGWSGSPTIQSSGGNTCAEAYAKKFDIYQEVKGAPVGVYEIQVQSFFRLGRPQHENASTNSWDIWVDGKQIAPAWVYMNQAQTPLKCVYSEGAPGGLLPKVNETDEDTYYSDPDWADKPGDGNWYPNNMVQTAEAFAHGMYKASTFGIVAKDGDVMRVGVKGNLTGQFDDANWAIFDNFRLIYRQYNTDIIGAAIVSALEELNQYLDKGITASEKETIQSLNTEANETDKEDGEALFSLLTRIYDETEIVSTQIQETLDAKAALMKAIISADSLANSGNVSERGLAKLDKAIVDATAVYNSELDAESINEAIIALNEIKGMVIEKMMLVRYHYYIPNESKYYYIDDALSYDNVKLTFNSNGNSTPRNDYSKMRLYEGNSVTFTSEIPIIDIRLIIDGYETSMEGYANEGNLESAHWTGEADKVTITNVGSTAYFSDFIITFDNPSDEEIVERLNDQVILSETAIEGLTHENVYGKAALITKISEAKALLAEELPNIALMKTYIKSLKADRTNLLDLEKSYTSIEKSLTSLSKAGQNNQFIDAAKLQAANTFITEVQTGIGAGTYKAEDIAILQEQIAWHIAQLQMVYLTITIGDPGTLGDEILQRINNFTDVQGLRISGPVDDTDMDKIKNQLTNLQEIDMNGINLKNLPREIFRDRTMLTSVVLPANLETIGYRAFYNCNNLENVALPATLKSIDNYAFYNCYKFTEVTIPEGVTSIGSYAFYSSNSSNGYYDEYGNWITVYYSSDLKKVALPSTLTYLGNRAFYGNRQLQEVIFGDGLTEIQNETFEGCTALKSVTLPSTIKKIGSDAFYNSGLKNIELPEGLSIIQSNAFGNCDSLTAVTLPSSVNSVFYPFRDCDNLTSITVKAIAPPYANDNDIMGGKESQCSLYVPELSLASYKQTDRWSKFAPNIYGLNIMPENIIISDTYRLLWPDTVSFSYKPNVELTKMDRGDNYWSEDRYRYAAVTVTGNATLSAKEFSMYWDYFYKRESNSDTYSRFATLMANGKIRTDNNTLKLHLRADEWNFIALPFDVKVSDIVNVNNTQFVVRGYDVKKRADGKMDETWYNMTGDDVLEAGKGYIWQGAHTTETITEEDGSQYQNENYDIEFDVQAQQSVNKNNMFRTGTVEVDLEENLSEFPQNRNWNFIGNPYPCYFDTRAIDCTAPITVWENGNRYKAISPVDDNYILAPGEAFFMQRPLDQASITFLREGRQLTPQAKDEVSYFAGTRQSEMTSQRSIFNLSIEGENQSDETRFVINEGALLSYEMDKDASKFMDGNANGILLYTIEDGLNYAINERPLNNCEVALGMKVTKAGTYTINLDTKADAEVYIIDLLTGEEVLLGEAGYTFQAEAGTLNGRFLIRLTAGEVTGIKSVDKQLNNENYYDLQGRRVENATKGVYIKNGQKVVVK
ncbi:MAG: leucine-rich repeat protein [Prevotella sp.]|nr:leucine-rich repeat protein [Prevotella sp.]